MITSNNKYSFKKALIALLFISASYWFMRQSFITFPYNIPFILLVIILCYLLFQVPIKLIGIKKVQKPFLFLVAALGVALSAEIVMDWLIQPLVNKAFGIVPDYNYFNFLKNNTSFFIKYLFYAWISAALGEELFFRGFMFHQLAKVVPPGKMQTAIILIIASLLFAFAHGYEGPAGMAMTFLWGILFGIIYIKTGNIWFAVLVHGFIDTIFLAMAYAGQLSYYELPNQLFWGY